MDNELKEYFNTVEQSELDAMHINDLKQFYTLACQDEESEIAARLLRTIRNELLKQSDSELTLDRMGLEVPTGTSFTAWLGFFKGLGEALTGDWETYRQELRDLPEQEGFPLNVEFPTKPEE
jgi:hypothetical protein